CGVQLACRVVLKHNVDDPRLPPRDSIPRLPPRDPT
ncbi:hypothetical protein A2U01_0050114, partial [Trifolium medium]|nr:hypothetical protein [Trifolium medium]